MRPTIIVLEGPNGSGKTHIAWKLQSAIPDACVYRPFKYNSLYTSWYEAMRKAGVPINTHVDDLYAADAIDRIARTGQTVILDRSFPSGIAYARSRLREHAGIGNSQAMQAVEDCAIRATNRDVKSWLDIWENLLGPRKLYVTMLVDYQTGLERTKHRERWYPSLAEHDRLIGNFVGIHEMVSEPKLMIDTSGIENSPERALETILHNLKRLG